jgi:MerR family transcriptional regulator, light-induced transcriptional regulator
MDHERELAVLRIGELSRRVGVSEHVLRAWESRYGLLKPARSAGGYRLYSEDDEIRVRRMLAHLEGGLAAAQAARAAVEEGQPPTAPTAAANSTATAGVVAGPDVRVAIDAPRPAGLAECADVLRQGLDDLDESAAQAVLDRLLTDFTIETVLRDVLLPYLHDLGERWEHGEVTIAQEHFASHVLRGRLTSLSRGWGNGRGPFALLACPPGEQHDLALIAFGIALNRSGWRVGYLGVNTPIPDLIQVSSILRPSLVVLAASTPRRFTAVVPELSRLAALAPLALAGAGARTKLAKSVGARLLARDPITEAEHLAVFAR